jgi:hypothetical protein
MDDIGTRTLIERLERLERANRRMRGLVLAVLGAAACAAVVGASAPAKPADDVTAKRFVVVDANNKPRATLGLSPHGSTGLRLYDEQQRELASLEVLPGSVPSLTFFGPDGRTAVWLISWPDVTTGLAFGDEGGNALAMVTERNRMRLTMSDANGMARTELVAGTGELPGLLLTDGDGIPRAELSLNEEEDPQLLFGDQYGNDRARLALEQGRPTVELLDEDGKRVWGKP